MDFVSVDAADSELKETATFGLAVCHTLHARKDGTLVGNHVDEEAFKASGGELIQKDGSSTQVKFQGQTYTVLKQYEFDSHRQTQSVIVEGNGKKTIFVKGSPEAIRALCSSGVPKDLDTSVGKAAKSGTYQLAIASKDYDLGDTPLTDISRDDVEKSLRFVALFSFRNSIREETPGVIQELLEGNVTTAMITGDSVLTGICIGRAAGIIPEGNRVLFGKKNDQGEIQWIDADTDVPVSAPSGKNLDSPNTNTVLAVTGETWTSLLQDDPKFAASIAMHIRVFGRCNPSDKVSVVTHFVEHGRKTLMCGDGGNDCGSLKAAHVGIALSTAEASVVAPFTSLDKCITSVSQVLREGRCALASAFAAYSYYIIYGQVESFLQVINAYFAM
jgi:magnesium-transporting ATPase (P-type)